MLRRWPQTLAAQGVEAIVLRTINDRPTLWEELLPEPCRALPAGLDAVDRLLADPEFFAPYRAHFHATLGRPSVPVETYLRMMFLKFRYRLGFEALCREVSDSISWRRFCRIGLGEAVPHPTTLMKTTKRCGESTVAALNETLLAKAAAAKVIRTDRVRADTTVVEANVAYPTDSGLLVKVIARIVVLVARIHAAGGATRTKVRDRRRSARRLAHEIGSKLRMRNDQAKAAVLQITGQLACIAELTATDAESVLRNARRALRRAGPEASAGLASLVAELETTMGRGQRLIDQARTRLGGEIPDGATRLVSLHDPDARPIRKGRLGRPVEFGYKAQVADNVDGVVLDHIVMAGNPPDAPLLAPAVARIKARLGRAPKAVTADRGYGEARVDAGLADLGVSTVAIPRRGRPGAARQAEQRRPGFVRLVKWRTGCEGRISHLKHGYGWNRTMLDGLAGAGVWCGYAVLAHNSVKIAGLIDDKAATVRPRPPAAEPPVPSATGPPGPRAAKRSIA